MRRKERIRVALVSLGCAKNLVDSEKILAHLAEGGCVVGAAMDQADVIVVNTCGFLAAARQESLEVLAEAMEHKLTGRARRVVAAGCLVSRDARKLYALAPNLDAIVGVNDRDGILRAVTGRRRVTMVSAVCGAPGRGARPELIGPAGAGSGDGQARGGGAPVASDRGRFRLTARHTAYLRIAEGCSQRCTFCAIPAIRGPFRSKTPEEILAEARELAADGAVELNVIAQDTTAYGTDVTGGAGGAGGAGRAAGGLAGLLRRLDRVDGLRWIRLMYAYPRRFSDRLIDAIAEGRRIVPYVDLPLQHISDPILRRMGRGVTRKATEALLDKLRRRVPGLVLRTALIVGFPGETDAHFQELLSFVKDFRFDALGVFPFSPEEGTPAARLGGAVPEHVKAQRARQIMLAQREIAFAAGRDKLGRRIEVLVDGRRGGRCVGRYYGQAPEIDGVCYLSRALPAGTFVVGTVAGCKSYDLKVQPVDA